MNERPRLPHAVTTFIFGALSVLVLVAFVVFIQDLFQSAQTAMNTNSVSVTDATNQQPLVQSVTAGRPQPLASDPKRGTAEPVVTIMTFSDFQCEACEQMDAVFELVLQEYPAAVQLVWKDFPIPTVNPQAEDAALAARCAQQQDAFWEYHDELYARQQTFPLQPWKEIADSVGLDADAFTACFEGGTPSQLVLQGYFIARSLNIDSAPSYYVNDRFYSGVKSYEDLKSIIDVEISDSTQ